MNRRTQEGESRRDATRCLKRYLARTSTDCSRTRIAGSSDHVQPGRPLPLPCWLPDSTSGSDSATMKLLAEGGEVEVSTTNPGGQTGGRLAAAEHAVALILAETALAADAYPKLLDAIATSLGWQFGAVWEEVP